MKCRTALTLAVLRTAVALRVSQCEPDEVAFAKLTSRTCTINWALMNWQKSFSDVEKVGCWNLQAFNTDQFMSSTLYQHERDGRCALVFSGYHGALAGYIRAGVSLVSPPTTWDVCGNKMYAPYVRLLRHHTHLANWSKLVHLMAGPATRCRGEPIFMAESMGGSSGEILAACANAGRLHELQEPALPGFHIQTLYTFGAPAASVEPITNSLRSDGCFKGKRIYFSGDGIAHFGSFFRLLHPRMDAVELWPADPKTGANPSAQAYACSSKEAVWDGKNTKPPPLQVDLHFKGKTDVSQHEITSYESDLQWLHDVGQDNLLSMEPMEAEVTNSAKFVALLQKGVA
mmetsp:Transcript_41291/g.95601  ORF Transcript_41291/g.95601 Transcript_41291/m.95601 type:complete len:344 (-) Transcript_41291:103-1134(-)